jgi:hypothetical protein
MAIPAGKIFMTTALLDALENEAEIEALLARAVAHIENRHSLKQFYLKSSTMKSKQFLQKLTRATGLFTGILSGPGGGAIEAIGNIPFQVSSQDHPLSLGFAEDFESAADSAASLYFHLQGKDRRHLGSVIRKLQLAALYFDVGQRKNFDLTAAMSNLELNEMASELYLSMWENEKDGRFNARTKRAENIEFKYFEDDGSFVFRNGRRFPVQLDLTYQSIFKNENRLMVYLEDQSLLYSTEDHHAQTRMVLRVRDRHGEHRFKLLERYTTADMWGVRMIFEAPSKQPGRFLEDIQDLEFEVIETGGPSHRTNDVEIEHYAFVKGRLEADTRVAQQRQPASEK